METHGKQVVVCHDGSDKGKMAMASLLALTTAVQVLGGQGISSYLTEAPRLSKYDPVKDRRIYGYVPKNAQGRNERCKCGSGKKYKKCCGK